MKIIQIKWKLKEIQSDREFYRYLENVLLDAKELGADKVILPDHITDSLLSLHPGADPKEALSPYSLAIELELKRLSKESGMIIEGGLFWYGDKKYRIISLPTGEIKKLL